MCIDRAARSIPEPGGQNSKGKKGENNNKIKGARRKEEGKGEKAAKKTTFSSLFSPSSSFHYSSSLTSEPFLRGCGMILPITAPHDVSDEAAGASGSDDVADDDEEEEEEEEYDDEEEGAEAGGRLDGSPPRATAESFEPASGFEGEGEAGGAPSEGALRPRRRRRRRRDAPRDRARLAAASARFR